MTTLCEGLTFGPPPKSATWHTLKEEHDVFVNLRPKTDTSHWYFPDGWDEVGTNTNKLTSKLSPAWTETTGEIQHDGDTLHLTWIALPIEREQLGDLYQVKELCRHLVKYIKDQKMRVYIHCTDGRITCGPIVLGCLYWLQGDPKFDPLETVHDGRKLRFLLCRAKPQRQQLDLIKEYAKKTSKWEQVGVVKRLKLDK